MSTIGRSGKRGAYFPRKMAHSFTPWKSSHMKNPPRSRNSRIAFASASVSCQRADLDGIQERGQSY